MEEREMGYYDEDEDGLMWYEREEIREKEEKREKEKRRLKEASKKMDCKCPKCKSPMELNEKKEMVCTVCKYKQTMDKLSQERGFRRAGFIFRNLFGK